MTEAQKRLEEAKAAYDEANARVSFLRAELYAANESLSLASKAVRDAQQEADRQLPRVMIYVQRRHRPTASYEGVIIKRSEKTIWAKLLGTPDSHADQYRLKKRFGEERWERYPSSKLAYEWLELPADSEQSPA